MNSNDFLELNTHKLFEAIENNITSDLDKTYNLLTVKDGVIFTWNFENSSILCLNLKAARGPDRSQIKPQTLLPNCCVQFPPECLLSNESGSLIIIWGSLGVCVLELPPRHPPFGAFDHNKEVIGCRSHHLDERLFLCSDLSRVLQVKFHPGSPRNQHILVLCSNNTLRLYCIDNGEAFNIRIHQIGDIPTGNFPGTETNDLLNNMAIDFDFGQPEIIENCDKGLRWPVYILKRDGSVARIHIDIADQTSKPPVVDISRESTGLGLGEEACSIICLNSIPGVCCIANSNGTIYHSILFDTNTDKELLHFEKIELELGLTTKSDISSISNESKCSIFLHKDESKPNRYFATHHTGIHTILMPSLKNLQTLINDENANFDELFTESSRAEYLVCTKTSSDETPNSIVGFALYYPPAALIGLLSTGRAISMALFSGDLLKSSVDESDAATQTELSPFKRMLREPFDQHVAKILQKSMTPPLLALQKAGRSQKECGELLQQAGQALRERAKAHRLAIGELEKRRKALALLKEWQAQELLKIGAERQFLQAELGNLAEKYEDIKDKQDGLTKRAEQLIVMVLQKKPEASDAEEKYFAQLVAYKKRFEVYKESIEKLKTKFRYQNMKISAGKQQMERRNSGLKESQSDTIKNNLKEMSDSIGRMVKEVKELKDRLNIK